MSRSVNHRFLMALVSREFETFQDVAREAKGDRPSGAYRDRMGLEVLYRLAVRRFGESPPLAAIDTFLAAPRLSTIAAPVPMIDREAVLRAILGERVVIRGMPRTSIMGAATILMVHINEDLELSREALGSLIGDAERHCLDPALGAAFRI